MKMTAVEREREKLLLGADPLIGKLSCIICNQRVLSTVGALCYSNLIQHHNDFVALRYMLAFCFRI
jgi:hypothetical protein